MIDLILMCIGGATLGGVVGYLLYSLGREIKRIHRVAKHYHEVAENPDSFFGDRNHFLNMDETSDKNQRRLYNVERAADNATYRVMEHEKLFKHTAKARKRVRKS